MTELNLEDPIQDHYKNHISKLLWQSAQNLSGLTQEKCLCRHKAQGGCPPPHGCPTHFSFNQAPSIWGFHQPLQLQRSHCWIPTGQSIKGRWRGGYCRPFRRPAWTGQSHPSSQSIMSTSSHGSLNAKRKWKQFCEPCIDATTKHQKWKSKPGKGNELDMIHRGKESACQCRRPKWHGLDPWVEKIPLSRKWQPTPVFLLGKFQEQKPGRLQSKGSQRVGHQWTQSHKRPFCSYNGYFVATLKTGSWRLFPSTCHLIYTRSTYIHRSPYMHKITSCTG